MGLYAMTGGATGIGAAIKERLRSDGHEVLVIDIKDADIEADLSNQDGRNHANSELEKAAPDGLDGFIACAGLGTNVQPPSLIIKVNYFGAIATIEGARDLVAKKKGSILLVSSNSAAMPYDEEYLSLLAKGNEEESCTAIDKMENAGQLAYGGGKLAVTRWMRGKVREYAAAGVRMNAIAPGFTETEMTKKVEQSEEWGEAIKAFKKSIPVGFAGQPEDQAEAAAFMLSDAARYICGSVLFVDGGHDATLRPDSF